MAKKRKVKDGQERGFQFPEFDRDEYVRKELRDARVAIVTLGYGLLFGLFSFAVAIYGDAGVSLGIVLGFAGMFSLRWFHGLAGIPVGELERKHIVGFALLFLMTWLAVWVVLSNPPASDISPPAVRAIEVREDAGGGNWTAADPVRSGVGYRVYAKVLDYGGLDTVTLVVDPSGPADVHEMTEDPFLEDWFFAEVTFDVGNHELAVSAEDAAGNTESVSRWVHVTA